MAWEDKRPVLTYRVRWVDGDVQLIKVQGLNYPDGSGHIQFWRSNQMVLSFLASEISQLRLMDVGGVPWQTEP